MADLSRSTNHSRFLGTKMRLNAFPSTWPVKRKSQEPVATALQMYTEGERLPPCHRLVVILPDFDLDVFNLPKKIWNLAAPDRREVLLLTKPCREENEFYSRVNLITLAALVRDSRVTVQTQQVLGMSLDQAARQCAQPGDVFVCFEEHRVPGFLRKNRLADLLARKTHQPVYTLKGPVAERTDPLSARWMDFVLLAICMFSLILFFALEVWIDQNAAGVLRTTLEILAVCAEAWVIGACANMTFRI